MKVHRIKNPYVLAVILSMAGCEFIGPQIHTKLPLPEIKPALQEGTITVEPLKNDDAGKTTKVEVFSNEDAVISTQSGISKPEVVGGKGEYSLNFDDADLGEVAKVVLSDILGKNYTISPQVTGKVTLQTTRPLSKEELLPTLDMLLSINNAALVSQNGMYLIKPSAEALYSTSGKSLGGISSMPSGYQVRVVPVKNVAAAEIAEILKPLLPEKALLHVDPKRNILLLAGSGSELSRAIDLVNTFDIDLLKGKSFALFTPAHVDASVIIEELEQIFNNAPGGKSGAAGGGAKKDPDAGAGAGNESAFYRFIEIDRLNAILAITQRSYLLKDVETWVLRLDKTNTDGKGGVNVYKAQHHSAADLANTLSTIFGNGSQKSSSASIASGHKSLSASNKSGSGSTMGSSGGFGSTNSNSSTGSSSGGFGSSSSGSTMGGTGGTSAFGNSNSSSTQNSSGGGGNGQSLMPNVKIIADESNNALIIVANTQEYAIIQRVLKQLDVLPLQVMIDATIVEVTLNNDLKYGLEWYITHNNGGKNAIFGGSGGTSDTVASSSSSTSGSGFTSLGNMATGIGTGGFNYLFTNHSKDIGALLEAAASNNNINVISSPSLMVLNNQEASILVGDSVPILTGTSTSLVSTGVTSNSVQMVDTGVSLAIRPRVNANGLVLMDLLQSVNAASSTTTSSISSPTISKRQIETSVAVQSGETIVLGGLIKEEDTFNTNGVPLLHEIPYIGPLFGGTVRNKDKTELVILLTPRVMRSRQDAQDVTEEFKRKLTGIYDERLKVDVERLPVQDP
ncbi:type II secretion system secretin GspD [Methylomonas paludis]|uniref:Type II secretion system secretin GspD n=1 Tax=Methylomonas paludis TaxID=1173101 RepID=A0A975MLB8_9GAMM|nr:type II secretion system secretin GspD [Methylomonas paludis]QWF69912.1 type II secretion system secretin GspD [Methylomonas paludis]